MPPRSASSAGLSNRSCDGSKEAASTLFLGFFHGSVFEMLPLNACDVYSLHSLPDGQAWVYS
jgi:hypothetical protein